MGNPLAVKGKGLMHASRQLRLEFHPDIRLIYPILLSICVKSGKRNSRSHKQAGNHALQEQIREVVITPVRRGGGILSI